jgi:hypothetical protein
VNICLLIICYSDPEYGNFEFAHFLFGTHYEEGAGMPDTLNLGKMRIPKLSGSQKNTVDYNGLNRENHSKM